MTVTSSVIFERLANTYSITMIPGASDNLPVKLPNLLTFEKHQPEILYICEWDPSIKELFCSGCVYLIISDETHTITLPSDCDAAFLHAHISPLRLLYEVF